MILVLPFFAGDEPLALKNLLWIQELDPVIDAECVLSFDNKTNPARMDAVARQIFKQVHHCTYNAPPEKKWPNASNWVFRHTAWHMYSHFKEPWLWLESDCVPIRSGWFQAVRECHYEGRKPFTGHWNYRTNVWNGVSVYPFNVPDYAKQHLLLSKNNPWDVMASKEVLPHLHIANHLFQHAWQDDATGKPYTFTSVEQARSVVRDGVVLFHRCKDNSLRDVLRASGKAFHEMPVMRHISVQRTGAIGDVITASVVCDKLKELGFDVTLHADPRASIPLQNTHKLAPPIKNPDVNLDGAYEGNPDRKKKHCTHIFIDKANEQLAQHGITLSKANLTPVIKAPSYQVESFGLRPWIGVCPKSNSFLNRSIPKQIWQQVVHKQPGTWIWLGTEEAPAKYVDAHCRNLDSLTATIAVLDVMVSVDTGPLHIAAALGVPVVGIAQSNIPWLTDQRDWSMIHAPLDCINCHELKCPINETRPPCCHIEPALIQKAVADKLEARQGNKVSAVIAVYKPDFKRLTKCIDHVVDQVDEVVVSWDGDGIRWRWSDVENPKIQYRWNTYSTERQGYGRTTNRGVRHSKGRYILLLNDDVFLKPDAVKKMMAAAVAPDVGIVGCLLRYPDGTIQHGGGMRKSGDVGWGHRDLKRRSPSISERMEMEFVTLAAAIVRREAFYGAMGFNENYDCYCEDAELCLMVRKNGWKVIYEPAAEGIHEESQTTGPMKKELGKASYAIFKQRWQHYFDKNSFNQLGTF